MLPSVSVVLPVGYGDRFFRLALSCALSQTYAGETEVILLDNCAESIEALVPKDSRIKYVRSARDTIGALRNAANALSSADIICNLDEDDWYAENRIATQVERLRLSERSVTGWHTLLFYNTADDQCYRYHHVGRDPYAVGTSLCYTRSWWAEHAFTPVIKGTDYWFQKAAADAGQLDSTDGAQFAVARAHGDSTCPPQFGCTQFPAVPKSALPDEFWRAKP